MAQQETWMDAAQRAIDRVVDDRLLAGALAIVWHQGRVVLNAAAGHRDIARDLPLDDRAIFQIASMTKPIVSVAALQLVDEGKLKLDDPIERWLPEFAAMQVLDAPAGPLDKTHPAPRLITVADLLTHQAGFGYAFTESGPIAEALEPAVDNIIRPVKGSDAWLADLAALPLIHDPGARFNYGHSTEVLGCLLARLDGTSLGESLKRRVLDPLGMVDTAFYVPARKLKRLAHKYKCTAEGLVDVTEPPSAPPIFEAGGGGLYSTASDYLTFARLFIDGGLVDGVRVLSDELCRMMMRNHLSPGQRALGGLTQPDFFEAKGFGYGVAVELQAVAPLHLTPGSVSWGGIWGTAWRTDPANRLIMLFFAQDDANVSAGPDHRDPAVDTPAKILAAEIEQLARDALLRRNAIDDRWVRLAPRHRNGRRAVTKGSRAMND